jgi:hypothetical protein
MNDRVDFVCVRADHQGSEPDDALTMHDDRWAYCPAAARERHDWRITAGISVEEAKQLIRRHPIREGDRSIQRTDR